MRFFGSIQHNVTGQVVLGDTGWISSRPIRRSDPGRPGRASAPAVVLGSLGRRATVRCELAISSIARITRCDRSGLGSSSSSVSTVGTICQDTPYRSSSQPHSP